MTALDQVTFDELEVVELRALVADLAASYSFEFTELRDRAQELIDRHQAAGDGSEHRSRPTGPGPSPDPTQEDRR